MHVGLARHVIPPHSPTAPIRRSWPARLYTALALQLARVLTRSGLPSTGGYAADFAKDGLLAKYRPELLDLPTTNGEHCQGDGAKMAFEIGANGIDLDKVQVHPTGLVDPNEPDAKVKFLAAEALRGCGGLLLNSEGDRFADELGHRDYGESLRAHFEVLTSADGFPDRILAPTVTGRIWEDNKMPVRLILNGEASKEIEWHCKVREDPPSSRPKLSTT